MSLNDIRAQVLSKVYESDLANPATWNGVRVSVRDRDNDAIVNFGNAQILAGSVVICVRRAEVEAAAAGDVVVLGTLVNGQFVPGVTYRIIGEPRLNVRHEWVCEAEAA